MHQCILRSNQSSVNKSSVSELGSSWQWLDMGPIKDAQNCVHSTSASLSMALCIDKIEHSHTFTFSFSINADWQIECRHVTGNVCVLSTKLSNQSVTKYSKPAKYSENQKTYKTFKILEQMTKLVNQNIRDFIRYIFQRKSTIRNGGTQLRKAP